MNKKNFLLTKVALIFLFLIIGVSFLWKNYKVEQMLRGQEQDHLTFTTNPILKIYFWDWKNEVEKTRSLIQNISNNGIIKKIGASIKDASRYILE